MPRLSLVKVYGNISPVDTDFFEALKRACSTAIADEQSIPVVAMQVDMALFSFEGVYFPLDDVLRVLHSFLLPVHDGKIDYLDLEAWRLDRYLVQKGSISFRTGSLNQVLEFSGH